MKQFRLVGYLKDSYEKVVNEWVDLDGISIDELINEMDVNNFNYYDWYLEYR